MELSVVEDLLGGAGAVFAYLHGSRVDGTARAGSDLDVAAWFGRDVAAWEVRLPGRVDLLVLDDAPLELAGRVAQHGRLLFEVDPAARVRWEATTRKVYLDERYRVEQARRDFGAVVDPERLHRLLRRVTDDLAVLQEYRQVPAQELLADPVRLGHVKYLFVTMLEGCIDAAHHVCAAQGYGPADTNADAMLLLGRHGVVTPPCAEELAQAVRFRNVLVHGYATVDDRRVVAYLGALDDVQGYVDQLTALL